jgi:hypothetical protein
MAAESSRTSPLTGSWSSALRSSYGLFLTLLCLKLILQFYLYWSGFVAVSADEHSRGIRAASWILGTHCTLGPPWCWPSWGSTIPIYTGAWLPFELYLNGLSIKISNNVVLAPRITALLSSFLALYFYFRMAKRMFNDSIAISVTACIILIFYPWFAWLSWAPMLDIYYLTFFLCGLYLFQLWLVQDRDYFLVASSLFMIFATGFHSQSWVLVNATSLVAGVLGLCLMSRGSYSKAAKLICYAIANNSFIALYIIVEFYSENQLFAFFADHTAGSKPFYDDVSAFRRIAYYPHLVIEAGKVLWILCLLSVVTIWTGEKVRWKLLPFVVGVIALFGYSVFNVFSVPATAAPGRYALPFFVLFSPYAAHGLFVAATTLSRAKWMFLVAAVIFVVGPNAIETLRFPHARDRAALEAGRYVGAAIDESGPGAAYMLEAEDWDFLAVMLTAAHYERGLVDRSSLPVGRQPGPSLLSRSRSALLEYLEANNIKVVAVKSAELKVRLDEFDFAMRDRQIGPWSLYRITTRGHSESESGAAQHPP